MQNDHVDEKKPAGCGLVIATPPSSCEGDQKRALVIEIENANLGDGNFQEAVASSLVSYAHALQRRQVGNQRREVYECPGGTILTITALV